METGSADAAAASAMHADAAQVPADVSENVTGDAAGGDNGEREGARRRGGRGRDRQRREQRDALPMDAAADAQSPPSDVRSDETTARSAGDFAAGPSYADHAALPAGLPPAPQRAAAVDATSEESAAAQAAAPSWQAPSVAAMPAPLHTEPSVAAAAPAAVVASTAPAAAVSAPLPYELPTGDLNALASGVGLEWVNSDAAKVQAVRDAMAAQHKTIHVPRLPRPMVVVDDGPLVLVETRKDLSQLKLPFDQRPNA